MNLVRKNTLIRKKFIAYLIPSILTALSSSLSGIVDGLIVGNMLGANELAAVNVCLPVLQIFGTVGFFFGVGASNRISIYNGHYEKDKSCRVFSVFCAALCAVGILFLLATLLLGDGISHLLCTDAELAPYFADYYSIISLIAPLFIIVNAFPFILQTEGRTRYAASILLTANGVNMVCDVLFMGPMKMGIRGAALATFTGYVCGFILVLIYIFSKKRTLRFHFAGSFHFLREIAATGVAGALGPGLLAAKLLFINSMMLSTGGSEGMIALSLGIVILQFFSMVITGVSECISPIMGIYYGERDRNGMRMVFRIAFRILMVSSLALLVVVEIAPQIVPILYGITDADMLPSLLTSLRVFVLALPGASMTYLLIFYFAATENEKKAVVIALVEGIVAIVPLTYLFVSLMGTLGIWVAFVIAESLAPVGMLLYMRGRISRLFELREPPAMFEFSVDMQRISDTVEQTMHKLTELGVPGVNANIISISVEEMAVHAAAFNEGKPVNMDVLIKQYEDGIAVSFCDDGAAFDPLGYTPREEDEWDNVQMLRSISSEMKYQHVIGLNKTVVYFKQAAKTA